MKKSTLNLINPEVEITEFDAQDAAELDAIYEEIEETENNDEIESVMKELEEELSKPKTKKAKKAKTKTKTKTKTKKKGKNSRSKLAELTIKKEILTTKAEIQELQNRLSPVKTKAEKKGPVVNAIVNTTSLFCSVGLLIAMLTTAYVTIGFLRLFIALIMC